MGIRQRANHQRFRFQRREKYFTVWTTKNKRRIPVHQMKTSHIENVIRYFAQLTCADLHRLIALHREDELIDLGTIKIPAGCFNPAIHIVMKAELRRRKK